MDWLADQIETISKQASVSANCPPVPLYRPRSLLPRVAVPTLKQADLWLSRRRCPVGAHHVRRQVCREQGTLVVVASWTVQRALTLEPR